MNSFCANLYHNFIISHFLKKRKYFQMILKLLGRVYLQDITQENYDYNVQTKQKIFVNFSWNCRQINCELARKEEMRHGICRIKIFFYWHWDHDKWGWLRMLADVRSCDFKSRSSKDYERKVVCTRELDEECFRSLLQTLGTLLANFRSNCILGAAMAVICILCTQRSCKNNWVQAWRITDKEIVMKYHMRTEYPFKLKNTT